MNLKRQHIGGLFAFLAGMIILAHAVVPHHHHFEFTHLSEQESTCESPDQENGNEAPISHCHVFNILVSEKTTNISVKQSLSENFNSYLAGSNANVEILPVKNVTETIFDHQFIFLKQFFFTAHSLRAPPATA